MRRGSTNGSDCRILHSGNLILDFHRAHLPVQRSLELDAAKAGAPIIECEHDITVLGQELTKESDVTARGTAPGPADFLRPGPAVHVNDNRVTLSGHRDYAA